MSVLSIRVERINISDVFLLQQQQQVHWEQTSEEETYQEMAVESKRLIVPLWHSHTLFFLNNVWAFTSVFPPLCQTTKGSKAKQYHNSLGAALLLFPLMTLNKFNKYFWWVCASVRSRSICNSPGLLIVWRLSLKIFYRRERNMHEEAPRLLYLHS